MNSFAQLVYERNAMYQFHPCRVTEKMRTELEIIQRHILDLLETKDFSVTILDMTTGQFIRHLPYHVNKLPIGNDLTIEKLKNFTTGPGLNFLFEAEQFTYEQIMALSPAKRPAFIAKWLLDFIEINSRSVCYQLTVKPLIFDNEGNPWLIAFIAQRMPASFRPKAQRFFSFSHTTLPLKEKKVKNIKLTGFHISILELIHDGDTIPTIVEKLHSTEGTMKRTLQRIYNKLGVNNGKDAYEVARKLGLLEHQAPEK